MNKKIGSLLIAGMLAASLLTGCGEGGTLSDALESEAASESTVSTAGSESSADETVVGETVTLRIWGGVPPESGPQASIDLFNETFADKGIQAEYERFVNDETGNLKLETSLMAGSDVDLYMSYGSTQLQKRASGNMALDLTELIEGV